MAAPTHRVGASLDPQTCVKTSGVGYRVDGDEATTRKLTGVQNGARHGRGVSGPGKGGKCSAPVVRGCRNDGAMCVGFHDYAIWHHTLFRHIPGVASPRAAPPANDP